MAMRLSGLMSGMDTESIVSQLVEAKKTKVTKAVKAQKTLKYKQDAWKDLNKQIMNLYNKHLSTMRFESSYKKKVTKVSDSSVVSVITGENAMNSVQSLKVEALAKTAFLTGSEMVQVADENGDMVNATLNTKLGELGMASGETGTIEVTTGAGDKTNINVNSNTTIGSFVNSLREAGVNVNFDASNRRIYIASKDSGAAQNFDVTGKNNAGLDALMALGLKYGTEAVDEVAIMANRKASLIKDLEAEVDARKDTRAAMVTALEKYVDVTSYNFENLAEADLTAIKEAIKTVGESSEDAKKELGTWADDWTKNEEAYTKTLFKLVFVSNVNEDRPELNSAEKAELKGKIESGIGKTATKSDGSDAKILLNGATYTSSKNTFDVNGITMTVNATTGDREVTITTMDDTDGIYDMVKGFLKEYNTLINQMDKLYNADSAKGYEPLTDEEKDAMSDSAVEEWENKIKDSILRRDNSLSTISSAMKRIMMEGAEVNGKQMYLSNFGINTLSYFTAPENEKNAYHIDGDKDDEATYGNADRLKSMIANDPDTVTAFFKQLTENMRSEMFDIMKDTDYSSSFTAYEDKKMKTDYDKYTTKIKELEKKLADYEDKWYAKFAAMETAMAKMQQNASAVTSLLGG